MADFPFNLLTDLQERIIARLVSDPWFVNADKPGLGVAVVMQERGNPEEELRLSVIRCSCGVEVQEPTLEGTDNVRFAGAKVSLMFGENRSVKTPMTKTAQQSAMLAVALLVSSGWRASEWWYPFRLVSFAAIGKTDAGYIIREMVLSTRMHVASQ